MSAFKINSLAQEVGIPITFSNCTYNCFGTLFLAFKFEDKIELAALATCGFLTGCWIFWIKEKRWLTLIDVWWQAADEDLSRKALAVVGALRMWRRTSWWSNRDVVAVEESSRFVRLILSALIKWLAWKESKENGGKLVENWLRGMRQRLITMKWSSMLGEIMVRR
jgi:hypothetical protein